MALQCARRGCDSTSQSLSFEKPLCHLHWEEWDAFDLEECYRCHWFVDPSGDNIQWGLWVDLNDMEHDLPYMCDDCFNLVLIERGMKPLGRNRTYPNHTVHFHKTLHRRTRFLYILKRDDNSFYVGQTIDLALRYQEHRDGSHPTTKGTNPKLVYYEQIEGHRTDANEREDELTLMALDGHGRRRIRDLIEDFRTYLRLIDLEA